MFTAEFEKTAKESKAKRRAKDAAIGSAAGAAAGTGLGVAAHKAIERHEKAWSLSHPDDKWDVISKGKNRKKVIKLKNPRMHGAKKLVIPGALAGLMLGPLVAPAMRSGMKKVQKELEE